MKLNKSLLLIAGLVMLITNIAYMPVADAYKKISDGHLIAYLLEDGDSEELPSELQKQMISLARVSRYSHYKPEDYQVVLLREGDVVYVLNKDWGYYYTDKATYDDSMGIKNTENEFQIKPFRGTAASAPGAYQITRSMFVVELQSKNEAIYNNGNGVRYMMPVMVIGE